MAQRQDLQLQCPEGSQGCSERQQQGVEDGHEIAASVSLFSDKINPLSSYRLFGSHNDRRPCARFCTMTARVIRCSPSFALSFNCRTHMSLPEFIRGHYEEIVREFAAYAKTLMPPGPEMTDAALRDHAKAMLKAVVEDMQLRQTPEEAHHKSQGRGVERTMEAAGRLHAADRIAHGYTFQGVLAEFRALRASVLRLYEETGVTDLSEVRRFNEAIDEALTESMQQFASETTLLREELHAKAEKNTSLLAEISDRQAAEERIKALFRRLVSMQDEERRRLSRDIHDQIGQQMTALRMTLEGLHPSHDRAPSQEDDLGRARKLLEDIDQSLQFLTWELRPAGALEQHGLTVALENLVSAWSERFGIPADCHVPTAETLQLPLDVASNLYALVQEALHNIVKHAGARHVGVLLQVRDREAVLIVEDNGRGFDAAQVPEHAENHGLGLVSMRERASLCGGTLEIDAAPGRGTTIFVRIPLTAKPTTPHV
jgi:signal transduction histidine kinase